MATLKASSNDSYLHFLQLDTTLPLAFLQSALVGFSTHSFLIQHLTGLVLAMASGAATMKAIRVVNTRSFFIRCLLDIRRDLPPATSAHGGKTAHPMPDSWEVASFLMQKVQNILWQVPA
jgi:hypothetical protein